jgi:hypothetical protein
MRKSRLFYVFCLSGLLLKVGATPLVEVAKTGQTTSSITNAPEGSDAKLQKGKAWPKKRFVIDGSGECISDRLTGLMWLRNNRGLTGDQEFNWDGALKFTSAGNWCGYNDWRIPNINELRSLINYGAVNNLDWLTRQGFSIHSSYNGMIASSTTGLKVPSVDVYAINIENGYYILGVKDSSYINFPLLPVRGGK